MNSAYKRYTFSWTDTFDFYWETEGKYILREGMPKSIAEEIKKYREYTWNKAWAKSDDCSVAVAITEMPIG